MAMSQVLSIASQLVRKLPLHFHNVANSRVQVLFHNGARSRRNTQRPKTLVPHPLNHLLEAVVEEVLRVEEEVVVRNAALEAAVVQKQDLLLTPTEQRPQVMAGIHLLPQLPLRPTEVGILLLLLRPVADGMLPQTAMLRQLRQKIGQTSQERIRCRLFRPKNPSLPPQLHRPQPNRVDGPVCLLSPPQLQPQRNLPHLSPSLNLKKLR